MKMSKNNTKPEVQVVGGKRAGSGLKKSDGTSRTGVIYFLLSNGAPA